MYRPPHRGRRARALPAEQRELYRRMADHEELLFQVRDGGREVTVANPTDRRIAAMVVEQRRQLAGVWDGDEGLHRAAPGP